MEGLSGSLASQMKSIVQALEQLCNVTTGILDNWHYLKRIGLVTYRTDWQKKWQDWCLAFSYLLVIVFSIIGGLIDVYMKARDAVALQVKMSTELLARLKQHKLRRDSSGGCFDHSSSEKSDKNDNFDRKKNEEKEFKRLIAQKLVDSILEKKLWFGQKFFDLPVQLYYVSSGNIIGRGWGHLLSLPAPAIFLYRFFKA